MFNEEITRIGNALGLEGRFLYEFGFEQIMARIEDDKRKDVLLKATHDLLKKCDDSHYVLSAMETAVFYDDAECDGHCLMEDIAIELGIYEG